jgi:hypothetical protein
MRICNMIYLCFVVWKTPRVGYPAVYPRNKDKVYILYSMCCCNFKTR